VIVTRNEFDEMLKIVADVTGRTLTDRTKEFYYQQVRTVEAGTLRQAINVFASRGHFPAANELLVECGYSPVRTREERHAYEERKQLAKEKNEQSPSGTTTPENTFGCWSFEVRKVTDSEQEARTEFANTKADRLVRNGWTVLSEDFHECVTEVSEGKRNRASKMWKMIFHCYKPEPEPPKIIDKKAKAANDWDPYEQS